VEVESYSVWPTAVLYVHALSDLGPFLLGSSWGTQLLSPRTTSRHVRGRSPRVYVYFTSWLRFGRLCSIPNQLPTHACKRGVCYGSARCRLCDSTILYSISKPIVAQHISSAPMYISCTVCTSRTAAVGSNVTRSRWKHKRDWRINYVEHACYILPHVLQRLSLPGRSCTRVNSLRLGSSEDYVWTYLIKGVPTTPYIGNECFVRGVEAIPW